MLTRKKRRLYALLLGLGGLILASGLAFFALGDNLAYFKSPTDILNHPPAQGQVFRLGGMVKEDSIVKFADGLTMEFIVSDLHNDRKIRYTGQTPDLFREGQGTIATGKLDENGVFIAETILAKHDENYMPKEIADTLAKQGDVRFRIDGKTYSHPAETQPSENTPSEPQKVTTP